VAQGASTAGRAPTATATHSGRTRTGSSCRYGVGNIGNVHVCRWGDGSEHFHVWFMARPARIPQLIGSFAAIWDDVLPPLPDELWEANLALIRGALTSDTSQTGV
jgi:hypothetical protein